MPSELSIRRDIVEMGRRLYIAGLMPGSDGNLSAMLNPNEILITPSRLCKGYMTVDDIIKIDRHGDRLSGELPPSLETAMHLAAYEERNDICAVVHSHPPICIAFTIAGVELPRSVLPEVEVLFGGQVPVAPYATPGTLPHHGALAVGVDVFQAGMRLEHVEAAARIIFYARQLGGEHTLSPENLKPLRALRQKLLETESAVFCAHCHSLENDGALAGHHATATARLAEPAQDELTLAVRSAVENVLRQSF
jgi:L-fuculose-phosphate aldolase